MPSELASLYRDIQNEGEGGGGETIGSFQVRARKSFTCFYCKQTIQAGELYTRLVWKDEGGRIVVVKSHNTGGACVMNLDAEPEEGGDLGY